MGTVNKLTAAKVRTASAPGLYGDGLGLYLQISTFNTKAWVFRYMLDGRARKMGLGPVHTVSLADARLRAAECRRKLLDGLDPIEDRDAAKEARKAAATVAKVEAARSKTFGEIADAYIVANRAAWKNSKHADQWFATFNETRRGKRVYPAATAAINDLPVSAIDTALVLAVLEPIWTKTPESASRIRGRLEAVLDFAKVRGLRDGDNPARWKGNLQHALGGRSRADRTKHHPAIPYREIGAFMVELRARTGISARALEFTILTAARTSEAIEARWIEINLDDRIWTIPGARMKAGREHRVPLSDRAVEILQALPREGDFVFPGGRVGRPLSNMAMLELLRDMRGKGSTVHGFRSTFRDWAAEQTSYPNELCEIALAHGVSDKTEAAYRRGDMFEKRRRLMVDWAHYCAEEQAGASGNVVSIRAGA
jgi:integrase